MTKLSKWKQKNEDIPEIQEANKATPSSDPATPSLNSDVSTSNTATSKPRGKTPK